MPEALSVGDSDVYLVGKAYAGAGISFSGNTFDQDPHEDSNSFIAKYSLTGELLWVRPGVFFAGKHAAISAYDVGLDPDGNVLVGEGYQFIWDSGMITPGIVHVVKYSPDGEVLFDISIGEHKAEPGDWPIFAKGLEVNSDGSFYIAGEFAGELVIGEDTIRTEPFYRDGSPSLDIFVAEYDPDGSFEWLQHVYSEKTDYMVGLDPKGCFTTDRHDNVYICGQMPAGTVFGEGQDNEFRMPVDAFAVAKYDPAGVLQWVKWEGDGGLGVYLEEFRAGGIRRIEVDSSDRLLSVWYLNDRGSNTRARVGETLVEDHFYGAEFLVAHEDDGSARLLAQFKSDGNEYVREITTDAEGNIYVSGGFDGYRLNIGETQLQQRQYPQDDFDGFIAKLDPDGNPLWTNHFNGAGMDGVQTAAVSRSGDVYAAGYFETELYLENTFIRDAVGWKDLILAKYPASTVASVEPEPVAGNHPSIGLTVYPNPAAASAQAAFSLEGPSDVRLELFDALGRQVSVLASRHFPAGQHQLDVPVSSLASGLYFLRGTVGDDVVATELLVTGP